MRILLCLLTVCFTLTSAASFAQDTRLLRSEEATEDAKELADKIQELTSNLSDENKQHFFTIYQSHNVIGAVKTVRSSVDKGVESCADNNPKLADDITARFDAWENAINPIIKDAEAQVENMVIAQNYAKPARITSFLRDVDKVRAKNNNSIEKVPVTTEKACESLLTSMDNTQAELSKMLRELLISIPRSLGRAQSL